MWENWGIWDIDVPRSASNRQSMRMHDTAKATFARANADATAPWGRAELKRPGQRRA